MSPRPLKPIAADMPAVELANELRKLRDRAGDPSYSEMARLVYISHNAMSETATGKWVHWEKVVLFVKAIEIYSPGLATPSDWVHLEALHRLASARRRAQRRRPAEETQLWWEQHDQVVDGPRKIAAENRSPGTWTTTSSARISALNTAGSRQSVIDILVGLLEERGILDFVVEGVVFDAMTLDDVRRLVRVAGETEGDWLAWRSAWERTADRVVLPIPRQRPARVERLVDSYDAFAEWGPRDQESGYQFGPILKLFRRRVSRAEPLAYEGQHRRRWYKARIRRGGP